MSSEWRPARARVFDLWLIPPGLPPALLEDFAAAGQSARISDTTAGERAPEPGAAIPVVTGGAGLEASPEVSGWRAAVLPLGDVRTGVGIEEDGRLCGDNTDAPGFMADLAEQGVDLAEMTAAGALVLGAGGSARAVVFALATAGIPVTVWARRGEQAQALCQALAPFLPPAARLHALPPDAPTPGHPALIVNCTPAGMEPQVEVSPWPAHWPLYPGQVVYDLVYHPPRTRFLEQAAAHGARGINGLGMLLHQGALAWSLWTGQPAPLAAMRRALLHP
jgi:hypothetical protein